MCCSLNSVWCVPPWAHVGVFLSVFVFSCYFRMLEVVWVVVLRFTCEHTRAAGTERRENLWDKTVELLIAVSGLYFESV